MNKGKIIYHALPSEFTTQCSTLGEQGQNPALQILGIIQLWLSIPEKRGCFPFNPPLPEDCVNIFQKVVFFYIDLGKTPQTMMGNVILCANVNIF